MAIKPPLSGLEQKVMDIIWSRNAATAADVQSALQPDRTLRDSTVRTVLSRLEEKGYLKHKVDGRTFVYSSVERPANLAVRAVKQIVDRLCHGSFESLLVGLVDDEIVDPQELQQIVDRLAAQRSNNARQPAKRKVRSK
jgi:predicted transcriptional regulator